MIIVTGAAGFIGSCLVNKLNNKGFRHLIFVDDFSNPTKNKNIDKKAHLIKVDRAEFFEWFADNNKKVKFVFHLGARTNTTEFNKAIFDELNLNYSKMMWHACTEFHIPLIYASSAATYGMGEFGYDDDLALIPKLKPLNPYGESKNDFDKWVLTQKTEPPFWVGFKFFNVYGPNEFHKGRMASVVFHAFNQIMDTGKVRLFRSHNHNYKDGEQLRDFIYVKDVIEVLMLTMLTKKSSGIYNLGTGKARSFLDLVNATFNALGKNPKIEFIDTPLDIRDKYQYFTEAKIEKLKTLVGEVPFYSLENGIADYVNGYLVGKNYY